MKRSWIRHDLGVQWPFLLGYSLLLAFLSFLLTALTNDPERYWDYYGSSQAMPRHDWEVYETFSSENIGRQGYLLSFVSFLLVFLIFLLLYSYVTLLSRRKTLFLLTVRGKRNVRLKDFLLQLSFLFLAALLSLVFYALLLLAFDSYARMEVSFYVFSPYVLLLDLAAFLTSAFDYLLLGFFLCSRRSLLSYLREEY